VIKEYDRKIVAVEMEGYGIARTCELLNSNQTYALIIKSVMDKTEAKDDLPKEFSSLISSLFIKILIESDILE
jgi:nucleoside phosphorylase